MLTTDGKLCKIRLIKSMKETVFMRHYESHPLAIQIRSRLSGTRAEPFCICAADEVTSTNTILKEYAATAVTAGRPIPPTVLLARKQTGGRGRLGRSFHSPNGTGLYMSILLAPTLPPAESLCLTTAAAAACAESADAIRQAAGFPTYNKIGIKWVNDLYLDGKKVCGILAEAALTPAMDALSWAVIGIGINLLPPMNGFPDDLSRVAGTLFPADHPIVTDVVLSELCADIVCRLVSYLEPGKKTDVLAVYRQRSVLDGREVLVRPAGSLGGDEIPATVCGIDDQFGLIVRYEDGLQAVLSSGEVVMCEDGGISAAQTSRASVHLS